VGRCTALRPFLLFQLSQPLNSLNFLNSLLECPELDTSSRQVGAHLPVVPLDRSRDLADGRFITGDRSGSGPVRTEKGGSVVGQRFSETAVDEGIPIGARRPCRPDSSLAGLDEVVSCKAVIEVVLVERKRKIGSRDRSRGCRFPLEFRGGVDDIEEVLSLSEDVERICDSLEDKRAADSLVRQAIDLFGGDGKIGGTATPDREGEQMIMIEKQLRIVAQITVETGDDELGDAAVTDAMRRRSVGVRE
jgi:hypothetical protein